MAVTIDEAIILTEIGTPKNRSTPNTTNNITVQEKNKKKKTPLN